MLFFDSGVGGLSIVAAARALLPAMRFVYAADSAGFPYGTKTEAELQARVPALLGRLVERCRARLVVIACNTASTIALEPVRAALDVPVIGTVPAIKPAAALTRSRTIGVLGTPATVRQRYVDDLAERFAGDCRVIRHGSAELVDLAEAKLHGGVVDPARFAAVLDGLFGQPDGDAIDVVVNACTHFPLVERELRAVAPSGVRFIDSGEGIARRIAHLAGAAGWSAQPDRSAQATAVFTRLGGEERALAPVLAHYGIGRIEPL